MLGVIHRHPDLADLLRAALDAIQPGCITIEFSRHGLQYRKTHGRELSEKVRNTAAGLRSQGCPVNETALDEVLAYLVLPAEFAVASAYGEANGLPVCPIDMDGPSRSYLDDVEELIAQENLRVLLAGPGGENIPREMVKARLFFEKGVELSPHSDEMRERDRHMRDEIISAMESHGCARFLHICGWHHLIDPDGLYAPLHPQKAFIHDKTLRV